MLWLLRNSSFEITKQMLKMMGKKIFTILNSKVLLILTNGIHTWRSLSFVVGEKYNAEEMVSTNDG